MTVQLAVLLVAIDGSSDRQFIIKSYIRCLQLMFDHLNSYPLSTFTLLQFLISFNYYSSSTLILEILHFFKYYSIKTNTLELLQPPSIIPLLQLLPLKSYTTSNIIPFKLLLLNYFVLGLLPPFNSCSSSVIVLP